MRQPGSNAQWWILLAVTLFIVFAWPPTGDKSLLLRFTNWVVDPTDALPRPPQPFGAGLGDDVESVEAHDALARAYDELYALGGWTRTRLRLKVAYDPIAPAIERQILLGLGVLAGFLVWRFGGPPR